MKEDGNIKPQKDTGSQVFYYSRNERLNMSSYQVPPPWHKRNRGMLILIVDFLIIITFFAVYQLFLKPDSSTIVVGDHHFDLRAVEFDGEVLASLKITAREDLGPDSEIINLQFSTSEDFQNATAVQDLLPGTQDYSITARVRLPLASTVYARGDMPMENIEDTEGVWDFTVQAPVETE